MVKNLHSKYIKMGIVKQKCCLNFWFHPKHNMTLLTPWAGPDSLCSRFSENFPNLMQVSHVLPSHQNVILITNFRNVLRLIICRPQDYNYFFSDYAVIKQIFNTNTTETRVSGAIINCLCRVTRADWRKRCFNDCLGKLTVSVLVQNLLDVKLILRCKFCYYSNVTFCLLF